MKKLYPIVIFTLCARLLFAQCGTVTSPQVLQQYIQEINEMESFRDARSGVLRMPVFYHLIGDNTHHGVKPFAEVLQSHCQLNDAYAPSDIQFYIAGIDTIYNSTYYNFSGNEGDQAQITYNRPNVCNVYINQSPRGLCGYATFPNTGPNGGGLFISSNCFGTNTTTLPHEMGHYLGLLHTFEGWNYNQEFVDGSNCASAGDYLCDTPADFLDNRWACPYTGNKTDSNGDLYSTVVDPTLYMSYSFDNCQNRFSPMQRTKTYTTLQTYRPNLLNQTLPDLSAVDTVKILAPLAADSPVNGALVTFRWTKSTHATGYVFTLKGSPLSLDTVITDTIFRMPGLLASWPYRYQVRPFSYGYTCTPYSTLINFRTAAFKVPVTVSNITTCGGKGTISFPSQLSGQPLSYNWEDGGSDTMRTNLSAGIYRITVTNTAGAEAISEIQIEQHAPVSAFLVPTTVSLIANASGGSAPYTYLWNDGSANSVFASPVLGQHYNVTVTDKEGCSTTAQFFYNSIVSLEDGDGLRIYPQPSLQSTEVTIESFVPVEGTYFLKSYGLDGRLLLQKEVGLKAGKNNFNTALALPAGIYILELSGNKWLKRQKVVIE